MKEISFEKQVLKIVVVVSVLFLASILEAEPLGTEFTYQGRLIDANNPAEGEYDFIFRIYDAESDGTQAGQDVNMPDVDVIDGYFTVELDFGNVFTGEARWLEIGVRTGDSNDVFTALSPRQKITALPYALYAASGISSIGSTETDFVTGSIPYDNNPPYSTIIGLVKDVSSEIPSGFTLIDVTAKGRKAHQMTGEFQDEPPLIVYPKVNGINIELLVWDAAGDEYGGANWPNMKAHIEYTLLMKKFGGSVVAGIDNIIEDIVVVWDDVQSRYEIPTEYNVMDTCTLKIEHLPNLVAGIGGMTQALVESNVKRLAIDVECYSEDSMDSYVGPCWTVPGTLSEDAGKARWSLEFKNSDGSSYSTNNWKLLKVTGYLKKSGGYCPFHDHDEQYYTKTEVDTMMTGKADKTEVEKKYSVFVGSLNGSPLEANLPLEWADFENVEVTATGYKYDTMDNSKQGPLIVVATVDMDTDKVMFEVWDTNGSEYGGSGWAGKEAYIDFVVFGTK